jgi:methylphosphotriester-DNA--protein-cysteine methyltransferase
MSIVLGFWDGAHRKSTLHITYKATSVSYCGIRFNSKEHAEEKFNCSIAQEAGWRRCRRCEPVEGVGDYEG